MFGQQIGKKILNWKNIGCFVFIGDGSVTLTRNLSQENMVI